MKKLIKYLSLMTMICCIFVSSSLCVLAKDSASPIEHKSKITAIASTKEESRIYNGDGDLLSVDQSLQKASCTHIPCNTVTDTVYQHRHVGTLRCDVYTAKATWCKCCNTILKFNSSWKYSYTHYNCNK